MGRTKRKDQAKGNLRAETAAAMSGDEDGDKGKYLLHKLFEDGGELYKATGHGVDGDCERVLFYEINGSGEGEYSKVVEVRSWVQEHEARNTERSN
jgi:hypothetical protein